MTWWQRLWHRKKMEEELEKELRFHLDQHAADLIARVIGGGMTPVLLGLVWGLAGAFALLRSLTSLSEGLLFEVRPTDPATFAAMALLLVSVAFLACYLPARRGAKVDPVTVLRHE